MFSRPRSGRSDRPRSGRGDRPSSGRGCSDRPVSGRGDQPPRSGRGGRPRSGIAALRNTPQVRRGSNGSSAAAAIGLGFADWAHGNRPGISLETEPCSSAKNSISAAENKGPDSIGSGKRRRRKQRRSSGSRSHTEDAVEEGSPFVEQSNGRLDGERENPVNDSLRGPPATPSAKMCRVGPAAKRSFGKDGRKTGANVNESEDTQSDSSDLYIATRPTAQQAADGDHSKTEHSASSVAEPDGDSVPRPSDPKSADERMISGSRKHVSAAKVKVSKESFEPARKQLKPKANVFAKVMTMNISIRCYVIGFIYYK